MQNTSQLDLGKLEDLFFCVDILTQARSALHGSHPKLAHNLALITDSVMDFAHQRECRREPVAAPAAGGTLRKDRQPGLPSGEDAILDVLTGETIPYRA